MLEPALAGNVPVLLTVYRSLVPPAKHDAARVSLDLGGPLDSVEAVDRARRKVAEAVFGGKIGIEDGAGLGKLLDSIGESMARAEQAALVNELREGLADQARHGMAGRITLLAKDAAAMLAGGRAGDGPPPRRMGSAALPVVGEIEDVGDAGVEDADADEIEDVDADEVDEVAS